MAAVLRSLVAVVFALMLAPAAYAAFPATEQWSTAGQGCTQYEQRPNFVACGGEPPTPALPEKYIKIESGRAVCYQRDMCGGALANGIYYFDAYDGVADPEKSYTCPSNATLSGSSCTCASGFEQQGSACVAVVSPEEEHCQSINGSPVKTSWSSTSMALTEGKAVCQTGGGYSCQTTVETTMCAQGSGGITCYGSGTVTGGACTPPPVETPTAPDAPASNLPNPPPPGTCPGEINGVTVNVPCSNTNTKSTTTSTSDDGAGNTTNKSESKATVCNAAGTCTTTTTTTTTVNGGSSTTTTNSTTQGKGEFCAANKGSAQCGDGEGSSFGGSCQASFVCTGDAVQCATAKAVNDQLCKLKDVFEMDTATQALVNSVMNGTWTDNPKDDPRMEALGTFDQSNPLSDACPGDVSIAIAHVTVVIPLARFCPQLQMMGNLLVAFTLLGATVFVVRGST